MVFYSLIILNNGGVFERISIFFQFQFFFINGKYIFSLDNEIFLVRNLIMGSVFYNCVFVLKVDYEIVIENVYLVYQMWLQIGFLVRRCIFFKVVDIMELYIIGDVLEFMFQEVFVIMYWVKINVFVIVGFFCEIVSLVI